MMSAVKEDLDAGDITNTDITDRKTLTKMFFTEKLARGKSARRTGQFAQMRRKSPFRENNEQAWSQRQANNISRRY